MLDKLLSEIIQQVASDRVGDAAGETMDRHPWVASAVALAFGLAFLSIGWGPGAGDDSTVRWVVFGLGALCGLVAVGLHVRGRKQQAVRRATDGRRFEDLDGGASPCSCVVLSYAVEGPKSSAGCLLYLFVGLTPVTLLLLAWIDPVAMAGWPVMLIIAIVLHSRMPSNYVYRCPECDIAVWVPVTPPPPPGPMRFQWFVCPHCQVHLEMVRTDGTAFSCPNLDCGRKILPLAAA